MQIRIIDGDYRDDGMYDISIDIGQKARVLPVENILYFRSENRIVKVFTKESDYVCGLSLNQLEERLESEKFARFHRSSLVNINKVKEVNYSKGATVLTMENGDRLDVSRGKRRLVKSLFSA